MRFHKSSTSESLLKRGPAALALMVASEFWRAKEGAEFSEDAVRCFHRARELMAVLEIADLPEPIGQSLKPYYHECRLERMFSAEQLTPTTIQHFSVRMAEAFDRIAQELAHA